MRPAEGEHHGICHNDARRVEVLAVRGVVHIGGKYRTQGWALTAVLIDDVFDVREASFSTCQAVVRMISPNFRVQEVHLPSSGDLANSPPGDSIHDEPLFRMSVLHVVDEGGKAVPKIDAIPVVIVDIASRAELIYLVAIEVKETVNLVVAFCQIRQPILVCRINQVDVALPRVWQVVLVLCRVVLVLEDEPFGLYATFLPSVEGAEAKIVEDALHASVVLSVDVVLDG